MPEVAEKDVEDGLQAVRDTIAEAGHRLHSMHRQLRADSGGDRYADHMAEAIGGASHDIAECINALDDALRIADDAAQAVYGGREKRPWRE